MAVELSKLEAILAREREERGISEEQQNAEALRQMRETAHRAIERSLEGVPQRLRTPRNLKRFKHTPLHELSATILAADRASVRARCSERQTSRRPRGRSRVRRSSARGSPSSRSEDSEPPLTARLRDRGWAW